MDTGKKKIKIGLALSGGGYRAAAFHLGVFRKLKKLNLIDKIDVISTVSGGSIAGTYYAIHKDNFEVFENSFVENLRKSTVRRIIWHWRFWLPIIILLGFLGIIFFNPFNLTLPKWVICIEVLIILLALIFGQFKIISFTKLKIGAYTKIFFGNKVISDLPDSPILAINATNLSTGTSWTFSKNKSSDSSYDFPNDGGKAIKFICGKMPLATAVASSSCVPFPFDPVSIKEEYFEHSKDFKRIAPKLIDGGLYDNQGIHKLTQKNSPYFCDIIIVSDGSLPFSSKYRSSSTIFILYRGIDVMMRKIKNLQFNRDISSRQEIAYFSLDWKYKFCLVEFIKAAKNKLVLPMVLSYHGLTNVILEKSMEELLHLLSDKIHFNKIVEQGLTNKEIKKISSIKTNLTALKSRDIALLSRHGEILTEIQIKLYCPTLITEF
ncbi:MAG: patatin-like phospholipase family protein [Ferruginibacter sp.]